MSRYCSSPWLILASILLVACFASVAQAFIAQPSFQTFSRKNLHLLKAEENKNEEHTEAPFESLGLSRDALNAVRNKGWIEPTPVQQLAIPRLLDSTNELDSLWCEAPTGSGKTAAYALPLLQRLMQQRSGGGPRIASLVLCPTRELAVQIGSVFQSLSSQMERRKGKQWRVQVIYGGVPLEPQIASLANCVDEGRVIDVLIATPGRMVDVLTRYSGKEDSAAMAALEKRLLDALDAKGRTDASLSLAKIQELELDRVDDDGRANLVELLEGIDYLVLDEADRLLGRPFEAEMNAVLDLLPSSKKIQTWLFSATFPKQIEPRADAILKRLSNGEATKPPVRISCAQSDRVNEEEVSGRLKKQLERSSNKPLAIQADGPASTIQLRTIRLEQRHRTQALRRLLESREGRRDWDRVLVFVSTRYASEHVARKLRRVGISAAELHGKLDQDARLRRLSDFSRGKFRVLLATDVASRGLDIQGLPAVFNYDLPRSTVDFVHRVGRTGRAGRPGTAVTFVTPTNEAHLNLIEKRHLANPVEREILDGFEPDEEAWSVQSAASDMSAPGTVHSSRGLAHDRMYGGVKGRRKSKKDKLREQAAREAA